MSLKTDFKQKPHYSNYLMVSCDGVPLSTVNKKRYDWYLKKGIAEKISEEQYKGYSAVLKLRFKHSGNNAKPSDTLIMENRCVVCGSTEKLSLHHVVPHSVKRFYPEKDKNYTRVLCVLVCDEHHDAAEKINRDLFNNPVEQFTKYRNAILNKVKAFIDLFTKPYVSYRIFKMGGIKKINEMYINSFKTLNPKYLPEEWLK